jgi:energy-coupling factor transporter ATP-binding protein EcfA2
MYVTGVSIKNVRSIKTLAWEIEPGQAAGWHVIIGDNGSGKSSVLRSIALALIGDSAAEALQQDWNTYLRYKAPRGVIKVDLLRDTTCDRFTGDRFSSADERWAASIGLIQESNHKVRLANLPPDDEGDIRDFHDTQWQQKSGWFSASYGPFRRFTGGEREEERLRDARPTSGRHLSLFRETIALTESLRWLESLQFKKLEADPEGALLDAIREFVNQEAFLPNDTRLRQVSSRGVEFVDGNGNRVLLEDLSDGYRSILSMTFDLIRQLALTYGPDHVFEENDPTRIHLPGVVLVDEIDVHLHPTWQRHVGLWFREHFPQIQFIVTSHSPFVCQASTVGTVYRLSTPGTEEEDGKVAGTELQRLLYGNILEAYGTELFGDAMTRSEESYTRLQRLAELNIKESRRKLSPKERQEQHQLRDTLPTAANTFAEETNAAL